MEKISFRDYTFDHWTKGYPEPEFPMWYIINEGGNWRINPVYTEIQKAKNYVFDKSFEFVILCKKEELDHYLSTLDLSEKIDYTQAELEKAKSNFSKYQIQDIIRKSHPNRLKDIDSIKYLTVKNQDEGLKSGKFIKVSGVIVNDFHSAVVNYYFSKYCHQLLSEEFKPERFTIEAPEKPEKGEPLAVRYSILNDFFNESDEFKKLSEKQKEKILAYILGTIPRTAKGMKNGESKYFTDDHKNRANDLINKIKKGDIL